jgi:hypothetical protein
MAWGKRCMSSDLEKRMLLSCAQFWFNLGSICSYLRSLMIDRSRISGVITADATVIFGTSLQQHYNTPEYSVLANNIVTQRNEPDGGLRFSDSCFGGQPCFGTPMIVYRTLEIGLVEYSYKK